MADVTGKGIPTRETLGAIGDIYTDVNTKKQYKCTFAYRNNDDRNFACEWKQIKETHSSIKEKTDNINEEKKYNVFESIDAALNNEVPMTTKRRDYHSNRKWNG